MASTRGEREAGEGSNVHGVEGVASMTPPVFEDVEAVAAEPRRWRPLSWPVRFWEDLADSVRARDF